jgi:hypothetical protein
MSDSNSFDGTDPAVITQIETKLDLLRTDFNLLRTELFTHLGIPFQGAPSGSVSAPSSPLHTSPSGDGEGGRKLDVAARYGRLDGLYDHMMTVSDLRGKFKPIWGTEKPRIHFYSDNSYLFYNVEGSLDAGLIPSTAQERKNCEAQKAIDTFGLDKKIFKPAHVAERHPHSKGQSVACPTPGTVMCKQGYPQPKKKWD